MKIIIITFENSLKEYSYLLDSKSFLIPKNKDRLYQSEGFRFGRNFVRILNVKRVIDVDVLPTYITSAIQILDINLMCKTYKIKKTEQIKMDLSPLSSLSSDSLPFSVAQLIQKKLEEQVKKYFKGEK